MNDMNNYTYEDCVIGLKENFSVQIIEEMLDAFKNISGDINPLHNEENFALNKGFNGRVAYGMLTASFLSTLAGVYLPGKNCLIQETEIKFARPVYVGDVLDISGEVVERFDTFKRITIKVRMNNQNGDNVLRGKMKLGFLE